ncbi:hypothetical protein R6Z07M_009753 [Ovis aries]
MLLEMATLGLVSLSALVLLVKVRKDNLELFPNSFNAEFLEASQLTEAIFQGYFAYSGLKLSAQYPTEKPEDTGELKKPRKTILKNIFPAFPLQMSRAVQRKDVCWDTENAVDF